MQKRKECSFSGCACKVHSRGLCSLHYQQGRKDGTLLIKRQNHHREDKEITRRHLELRALVAERRRLSNLVKRAERRLATTQVRAAKASAGLSKLRRIQNLASIDRFKLQAAGVFKKLNGSVVCLPNIPCAAGVYAQMLNGRIVRIGQSTALCLSRAYAQSFLFDSIAFMPCASEDSGALERALYKIEQPELNSDWDLKNPLTEYEFRVFKKYAADSTKKN